MFTIPNLGFSVINGLLLIGFISGCVTLFAYYNVHNIKSEVITKIKKQEDKLSIFDLFLLYLNRFIHYFNFLFLSSILFLFKPNFYLYIIALIDILIASINIEIFKNECPITYLEKKILDNKYIFNSTNGYEPFKVILLLTFKEQNINIYDIILRIFIFLFLYIRLYKHFFLPKSQIPEEIRM